MNMTRDLQEFWTIVITTFIVFVIIDFGLLFAYWWIKQGVDDSDFYKE